jgi:predicted amidohydrolase YtcJ
MGAPDLILHNGRFTILDKSNPVASAVTITEGKFASIGREEDVMPLAGSATRVINPRGRSGSPELMDNHIPEDGRFHQIGRGSFNTALTGCEY